MKRRILILFLVMLLLSSTTIAYGNNKDTKLMVPIIPHKGVYISSLYGYRIHPITNKWQFHSGVDIAAPKGTPVYAIANGKVIMAKPNGTAGNEIRIDHGNGVISKYLHMHQRTVKVGDIIEVGQIIGTIGSTGSSTGPHLHFGLSVNGKKVNPINIVIGKF